MDKSSLKDFTYYSRIVMFILCSIQFILFIVFIAVIYDVKDTINENKTLSEVFEYVSLIHSNSINNFDYRKKEKLGKDFKTIMDEQGQGIAATFSFFIISYVIFFIECIIHFCCEISENSGILNDIFKELNHFIILSAFIVAQFMYIISCLIIPIYLDRVRTMRDMFKDFNDELKEELDSCVNRYAALLVVAFVFLFIFIFLYFIILNLYKGICCDMPSICFQTEACLKNFFTCYYRHIKFLFTCERADKLDAKLKEEEKKVEDLKLEVKSLMAENLKLRLDKIEYL